MDAADSKKNGSRSTRVVGVVLAAGGSSRLGRPKQLLPLDGVPVIRWTAANLLRSRLDAVVVVVGHEAAAVADALDDLCLRIVVNPAYADGQSSSLRAGLGAVDDAADAVLFALGDQPEIGPEIVDALIGAYAESRAPIVQPAYGGIPGNPVLFARSLFPELAAITGDQGARSVIRAHAAEVLRIPVSDAPPPADIDTEADYEALTRRWKPAR